eukprot:scaffold294877_cov31-Tisochrysis_lutea.AAC.2
MACDHSSICTVGLRPAGRGSDKTSLKLGLAELARTEVASLTFLQPSLRRRHRRYGIPMLCPMGTLEHRSRESWSCAADAWATMVNRHEANSRTGEILARWVRGPVTRPVRKIPGGSRSSSAAGPKASGSASGSSSGMFGSAAAIASGRSRVGVETAEWCVYS